MKPSADTKDISIDKEANCGKYLYAIAAGKDINIPRALAGIESQPVYGINGGKLTALVSDYARTKIRPERRHLAAHQEVLKALMAESTVLPITFGVISQDTKAVLSLLELNQDSLQNQLQRVHGKVEMGLRIRWDVPNIFEFMIDTHDELRVMRDRLFSSGYQATHEEKIAVGQFFEQLLNEQREIYTEQVENAIAQACAEVTRGTLRNEVEIANLNCLVPREKQTQFEDLVVQAAGQFDNNYAFDLNGPFAPHNFVEAVVDRVPQ